jgi:hypothetical protein
MPMKPPAPTDSLPAYQSIGISVFVFCCLLSSLALLRRAPKAWPLDADDIATRSDERFAAVKAKLPAQGVIGYIGEPGNSGTADYYLAQYALAPLIVDRSPHHALVLGSFPDRAPEIPQTLQLIDRFGPGVLLLRNAAADSGTDTVQDKDKDKDAK